MAKINLEELATFCKKKGFVFQAAEIYGGLAGFFDFGPLGVELKNNLKQLYWREFVQKREDMVGQDGAIITNPKVWKASGHVDGFADLVLTTKETKTKIRADHFIEDTLNIPGDGLSADDINKLVEEHKLTYNGEEFEKVNDFNLMFNTQVGASVTKNSMAYLRPETAQSIFPNFKIIAETSRMVLPFGITQIGKAYRNEISPRDFVFRCREFEQMEMEYFYNPETECEVLTDAELDTKINILTAENQDNDSGKMIEVTIREIYEDKKYGMNSFHAYWLARFFNWLNKDVGLAYENLRVREHVKTELSHYSTGTFDIDFKYPMGFKEMLGMANRGCFDLTQHQDHSKKSMEIFDEKQGGKVLANVVEPSMGVERFMMAVLYQAYQDDKERGNVVLKLTPKVAPYKVAVFPLVNKGGLPEIAREIMDELLDEEILAYYDRSGSVGKRYARQDEIGTPYCVTVDFECVEDGSDKGTVTIRDRDSTAQKRIKVEEVSQTIRDLVRGKISFDSL